MKSDRIEMPAFRHTAAMLRDTTELLAHEVSETTADAPQWDQTQWAIATAVAALQGISGLLTANCRWHAPPGWQAFLAEQTTQLRRRESKIDALIKQLGVTLIEAQIAAVGLKGTALRKLDIYRSGERPMADVDLLVRPRDMPAVEAALQRLDYVLADSGAGEAIYLPKARQEPRGFGEHVDNPISIEVHTRVAAALPVSVVDITSEVWPEPASPGLLGYSGTVSLMLHFLLHAAKDMRAHALRQIQLHDIALLANKLTDSDWRALLGGPGGRTQRWWCYPPLVLTNRYYSGSLPAFVIEEARRACPLLLRTVSRSKSLTDVSWSNLRIHAFPGIAWSRSTREALRFIRSRILPRREAVAELHKAVQRNPNLAEIRWYGISHSRRILKWIFLRPPRVQTMLSIRAALEAQFLQVH